MLLDIESAYMKEAEELYEKRIERSKERISQFIEVANGSDQQLQDRFSQFILPMLKENGKLNAKLVQTSVTLGVIFARVIVNDTQTFDEFQNIWRDEFVDKYRVSYDESASKVIREYAFELSRYRDDQSVREVKEIVSRGIAEGKSHDVIKAELFEKVDKIFSMDHADTVSRTESARGFAIGNLISYMDDSNVEYIEYSAVLDERTTEVCKTRDGGIYRKDDERVRYMIPAHYRCRSIWVPVIFEEPEPSRVQQPNIPEQGFVPQAFNVFDIMYQALIAGMVISLVNEEEDEG